MVKAIDVVSTMDCSNKNDIPRQEWQSLLGFEMVTAQCSNCYAAAKTPILYSCRLQEHQILEIDECPLCPVPPNIWWRLNPLQMNIKELQNIKNSKNLDKLPHQKFAAGQQSTMRYLRYNIIAQAMLGLIGSQFLIFLQASNRWQSEGGAPLHQKSPLWSSHSYPGSTIGVLATVHNC